MMNSKYFVPSLFILVGIISFGVSARSTYAQSGFEDSSSQSSIIIRRGGMAKFDVTDTRLTIGYAHVPLQSNIKGLRVGAEVSAAATEGLGALLEDDGITAESRAILSLGRQYIFSPVPLQGARQDTLVYDDWAGIEFGYSRAVHSMVQDPTSAEPVKELSFDGASIRGYYNALPTVFNGVVGLAIGTERRSNYNQLAKVKIDQEISVISGDTTRVVSSTIEGRSGEREVKWAAVVSADVVWLPIRLGGEIGFNAFLRYSGHDFIEHNITKGVGLIITGEDNPTKVLGGLSLEFIGGEINVGMVAGFTFGSKDS